MTNREKTRNSILAHCQTYPQLQIRDVFKFIYQSSLGCEHMVPSLEMATEYIKREYESGVEGSSLKTDALDGNYCRVHLSCLNDGLSADTIGKLFFLSAKKEEDGLARLADKLCTARELAGEGLLPFTEEEFTMAAEAWKADGYPPVHHSDAFREAYHPAYRVISRDFVPFLPLLAELDRRLAEGKVHLAVEGGSASGKTTLSKLLEAVYGCRVFHMDDFFLRPEQRTPERFAEPGGNVDRERFLSEVLLPFSEGKTVNYRRFNCSTMTVEEGEEVSQARLTVTEGAYSMHPELAPYYDLSVLLDVTSEIQKKRIEKRNSPQMAKRFFEEWIPLEAVYFEKMNIKDRCDMVIRIEK